MPSKKTAETGPISIRPLTPDDWPVVERLFGEKGACGGCWCMYWRVPRGGKTWETTKGERARRAMQRLVRRGDARAMLAFDGDEPIAWCALGPRADFPRLERVKAYQRPAAAGGASPGDTWSIPCFFILPKYRGRGVGTAILAAAAGAAARAGARRVEGYPVAMKRPGDRWPGAFAWTGVLPMFEACGFEVVQRTAATKPLVQLTVGASPRTTAKRSRAQAGADRRKKQQVAKRKR